MTNVFHYQLEDSRIGYMWSHEPDPHTLVVLHGLGDSAIHTYAPRFASSPLGGKPTLFIDFPGFGEGFASPSYPGSIERIASDLASLLESLSITQAPVFAHSMGANVAIMLAHSHPELVSRLILAEPLLNREESILAANIAKRTEDAFVDRGYPMLLRATTLQAQRGEKSAKAFLTTLKMADPVSMYRAAVSLVGHRDPGFGRLLLNLQQSMTLITGADSDMDTSAYVEAGIAEVVVPDAGHFMVVEQTELTICAILKLVD